MNKSSFRSRPLIAALGLTAITLTGFATIAATSAHAEGALEKVTSITLLGKPGGGDYMHVYNGMLYVANTQQGTMSVIDCSKNTVVTTIPNLPRVHGFAAAPSAGKGYITVGGDNTVAVIDLKSHLVLKKIPVGVGPDAITYAEKSGMIIVGDHRGKAVTIIDPRSDLAVKTAPVGGTVESLREDPKTGIVFANLEDTSEMVALNPKSGGVLRRVSTAPGEGPTGLAIDPKTSLLFVGCGNAKLLVVSTRNGKILQTLPIGEDVDYAEFDPTSGRIYTANGSGSVSILEEKDGKVEKIEDMKTVEGAHTLALDEASHRVYVLHQGVVDVYQGK